MASLQHKQADWLAQVREPIVDPDLPIIDPHHHLMRFTGLEYEVDQLHADTGSGHRVEKTVFIECGAADGEGFSNSLFFELKKNWTGLLVEPNNEEFDILKQRHRKATLINACLSNTEYSNVKHTYNAQ